MKFLHNIGRIEAFSDAVFAFAATLMVVNFDLDTDLTLSKTDATGFLSFAVSFFVLVALWWAHYNFFRRTKYMDNVLIALNALLLFVVLYYVFPLKSLVHSWMGEGVKTKEDLSNLFVMYGIGFSLIFFCFSGMYFRAYKKSKSSEKSLNLYFYARHFAIFVLVSLISIVLALFGFGIEFGLPGFFYALLGRLCYLHSKQFYKRYELNRL